VSPKSAAARPERQDARARKPRTKLPLAATGDRWKLVMQYGQQLLSDRDAAVILNTLTALDEGVLSKLARWLDAAGELWITRELLPTFHDQLDSGTGLFWQSGSSEPAETWMRRTLRKS